MRIVLAVLIALFLAVSFASVFGSVARDCGALAMSKSRQQ